MKMIFLTGRDTDLLILEKLEDKDILNVCLTNKCANKLCNDEFFWKNRFLKKWGHFDKSEDKSWKKFYLLVIKYLNISFGNTSNIKATSHFSYVVPYNKTFDYSDLENLEFAATKAAENNHMDIVNFMIERGAKNFDDLLTIVSKRGDLEMVKFMIEKGAKDFGFPMATASAHGHIDIVKLLIDKKFREKENWIDNSLYYSSQLNHIDIVKLLVEKGAKNFTIAIKLAKERGYIEIVEYLISELKKR